MSDTNKRKGILLIILAALFFSLMATTVKSVNEFPLIQKVFFRNFIGVLILSFYVIRDKSILKVQNKKLMAGRCAFGLTGVFLYYWSLSLLNLSEAVVINKLSPFFVIILGGIFLKEKIRTSQIFAVLVALAGIVVLLRPQMNVDILPAMVGLLGAVAAAAAYTIIRELRHTDGPMTIVFYFCLSSTIITAPIMISQFVMPTLTELLLLCLIGVFALIAQLLMTNAYRYAPASQLSIYTYMNIIFSSLWGVIFWSESLSTTFLLGAGLIIFAGFINFYTATKNVAK
ncbi:DMT family transporter [Acidaminobacter sp. JC074]|uniref:DMT family transporter n=1 Tax=Acidaminobacter sp. JC074 TaxID=2530199 RepID=UPI001F10454E|nr:DMT family transporter [Acidaminobacter sp. JC074]MCH4887147.1 DMT family transporter [Acidaminobacter sp. JC074]